MSNVTDLADWKYAQQPHLEGSIKCMECGHEWRAVRPKANEPWWFECPSCGLEKGRPVGPYEFSGPTWVCKCGNDLFHLMPQGAYCPHCATWFMPEDAVGALTNWASQAVERFTQDLQNTLPGKNFGKNDAEKS